MLHHHIDVVYADRRYWTVDPFGGVIKDGYLYGRGALDMKSTGILQLAAMLAIKRARVPLKRDLIFLATADEEAGSALRRAVRGRPAPRLARRRRVRALRAGRHRAATPAIARRSAVIVISEKTGLPLRLTARSEPGHGSMPWPDTAPHRLVRALGRLLAAERPLRVLPEVAGVLPRGWRTCCRRTTAAGYDDISSARCATRRSAPRFLANRYRAAMVRTTFAVNMLRGSEKLNVIPPEAVADIDCRMLAGDDPRGDPALGARRDRRRARWRSPRCASRSCPTSRRPTPSSTRPWPTRCARARPARWWRPTILVAFTDNWVFRELRAARLRLEPVRAGRRARSRRIHGNDERISLDNMRAGVRAYTEMLLAVAAA